MYHLLSGIYSEWTKKKQFSILLIGQGSVGKTSLLEGIKSDYTQTPSIPIDRITKTVGQNVLDVAIPSTSTVLHFWDLGGEPPLRRLWEQYFTEADMLMWVVDGNDWQDQEVEEEAETDLQREKMERRNQDWNILASILSKPSLQDIPLLIALNKLDNLSSEVSNPSSASTSASWFEARLGKSLPNEVGRSRTVQGDSHSSNTASTQIEKNEPIPKIEDGSEEPKLQSRSWESVEASAWKKVGIKAIVDSLVSFAK